MIGVGIVAPSGAVRDDTRLERAAQRLAQLGFHVVVPEAVRSVFQRFAGADASRLAALHELAERPDVDIIMAARGGYGLSRLLDRIDYSRLAASKKILVGHSDFTALQLALLARERYVTFAGPNAIFDFGAQPCDTFTEQHFMRLLEADAFEVSVQAVNAQPLSVEGVIWGGNLSLLAAMVGTPYFPDVTDGVLFLEDVNEHPYRIERMLYQLFHAGVLQKQRAVLLGDFSGIQLVAHDAGYDLTEVMRHFRERLDVPLVTGLPFGHRRAKLTMPVGARCRLDVSHDEFRLRFWGYPWLSRATRATRAD